MASLSGRPILGTQLDRELFVDAEVALDRVLAAVSRRVNCLVLGTQGSGKTSFLNMLSRSLESRWDPVYIDGRLVDDAGSLLSLLTYSLGRERLDPLSGLPASQLLPGGAVHARQTEQTLAELDRVRRAVEQRQLGVVVMVDELRSADLAHTLFGRMRDELWSLGCVWVVAGDSASKATLVRPPADAFFETIVEIAPLDRQHSIELLRRRLRDEQIDEDLIPRLADLAEGNPRRLINLARSVVIDGISPVDAASRRSELHGRAVRIGEAARRLVEDLMAHGPASASDEALLARLDWSRARATQVFRQLEEQGIVRASTERSGRGARKVYELAYQNES